MTKKTRIAAALLVLALLLGGCGAAAPAKAAPSPTPGPTPTPTPRPDRNGFDPKTNQTVVLGGLSFELPSYYEEASAEEGRLFKITYPLSNAGLVCKELNAVLSDQQLEENKVEIMERLFSSSGRTSDVSVITAAGMKGLLACYSGDANGVPLDFRCVVVNDPGGSLYLLMLFVSQDSPYDYTADFDRILSSARRTTESAAAPTAEPKAQTSAGQVDPELKAMLDEYEEFIDEYVAFMKDFNSGKTVDLSRSVRLMTKYADLTAKIEAIDEKNLSDADYLYYSQVMLRVSQKLLEAAG